MEQMVTLGNDDTGTVLYVNMSLCLFAGVNNYLLYLFRILGGNNAEVIRMCINLCHFFL